MKDSHIVPVIRSSIAPCGRAQPMLPKGDRLPRHRWPLLPGAAGPDDSRLRDRLEDQQRWCSSTGFQKNPVIRSSVQTQPCQYLALFFFCGKCITDQYSMCYFVRRWVTGWIMNRRSSSSADTIPHPFLPLCINSACHLQSEPVKDLTASIRFMIRSLSASQVSSIHKNSGLSLLLSLIQVRSFSPNWARGWTRRWEEKTVKTQHSATLSLLS